MRERIYQNMCLITLVTIVLSSVLSTVVYYNRLEMQMKRGVITKAKYLQSGMELSGNDYLTVIAGRIRGGSQNRITLVGADGTVLYGNHASSGEMENYGDRSEVLSAFKKGSGENTRFSEILAEKTYYCAVLLNDGTVVRVADTTKSVLASVLQLIPFIAVLAVAVLALSMALTDWQTKQIVKPINELDLDHPEENHVYDELAPLIGEVERQQRTIQSQIDTLKAEQKEFAATTGDMSEGFIAVGRKAKMASYNTNAMRILGVDEQYAKENGTNILNFNRSQILHKAVDDALNGMRSGHYMDVVSRCYQIIANPVTDGGEVSGAIIVTLGVTEK